MRRARPLALTLTLAAACAPSEPSDLSLSRPSGHDIVLPRETDTFEAVIARGATLDAVLRRHGVASDAVAEAIDAARHVFDPRRIRAGQPYTLVRTLAGRIREFRYEIDFDRFLHVSRTRAAGSAEATTPALVAEVGTFPRTIARLALEGRIDRETSSLVAAIEAAGQPVEIALGLADVFGGEVDFYSDPREGDTFAVLYDSVSREGRDPRFADIQAAEFVNDGRRHRAYRFTPAGGRPAYYDEHGRSLRRLFLRSPLKFEPRVTSGFSRRRLHPVLRTYRPHLGVDYRAAWGAPVVAVADGIVVSAGSAGASGRMVRIRHAGGYESYYLHLSTILVRSGRRVSQGQVIGRVGATGLATAAHLDYRLRRHGVFVNPLTVHRSMPPGVPIEAADRPAFEAERDRLDHQLRSVAGRALGRPITVASQTVEGLKG
jgi:murein DD-endopeptidase MepM/ murein hydrolase activator NlpD